MVFLTAKQRLLVALLEHGPLPNAAAAEKAGITPQYCSRILRDLKEKGLVNIVHEHPRSIVLLTEKGRLVAQLLRRACLNFCFSSPQPKRVPAGNALTEICHGMNI